LEVKVSTTVNAAPLPRKCRSYFDTIAVWLDKKPSNKQLADLKRWCGERHVEQKQAWWNPAYRCRLQLHQPTRLAFKLLVQLAESSKIPPCVNQVHIALDWIMKNLSEAQALDGFVDDHLVQKWQRKRGLKYHKNSRYSAPPKPWRGQRTAVYADKPSRHTGQPCVHLEWRVNGAATIKRLGIEAPSDLPEFDFHRFWKKHLCLMEIRKEQLGKQRQGRACAKKPKSLYYRPGIGYPNHDLRVGELLVRATLLKESRTGNPIAQAVMDQYRGTRWFLPTSAFKPLSLTPYLPK
jgi:hypothetical protein